METSLFTIFQHPICNVILMMTMIAGLVVELQVPGKILPLVISLVSAVCYFVPYYMMGTVETWELLVFVVGFIFLLLEIFVIPGFGFVGITGFIAVFVSLALVTLKNHYLDFSQVTEGQIAHAVATTIIGAVCSVIFLAVIAHFITNSTFLNKKIALQTSLSKENGYHIENQGLTNLIGQKGIVYHKLRPIGKVMVNNAIYEASSKSKFIEQGHSIEVIGVRGNVLLVG